jgi:hypothetical protein
VPRGHPEDRLHAGPAEGNTAPGRWKVLSGTGAFEGLKGGGQMETVFESDTRADETFTGTVVP